MAWDIILKSLGVIVAIMVVAQVLYVVLADKNGTDAGNDQ